MRRNYGVELLRNLLMLGIVALHTLCYVGKGMSPAAHLCESCVVGFVFISGYFGISFTIRKLLNFYGIVLFCGGWNVMCLWCSGCEVSNLWRHFIGYLRVWWFANAYVFLMLMSPLVNKGLDACRTTRELMLVALPAASIVFLWGFASSVPFLHDYIPVDKSVVTNSGITLMAIYILARVFRMLNLENWLKPKALAPLGIVSAVICMFNLGKYNSIFALTLMASIFVLFKDIGESHQLKSGRLRQISAFCAPSMFSVYLIHVGGFVHLPGGGVSTIALAGNNPCVLRLIGVVAVIFTVSLCVDLTRRMALSIMRRVYKRVWGAR